MYICITIWIRRCQKELEKITKEAKEELELFGEKANFLKKLAEYIANRNK